MSHRMWAVSRSWKRQEKFFSRVSGKEQPCQHLAILVQWDFSPVRLILVFWPLGLLENKFVFFSVCCIIIATTTTLTMYSPTYSWLSWILPELAVGFCWNPSGPAEVRKPIHTTILITTRGSAGVSFANSPDLLLFANNGRGDFILLSVQFCCTKSSWNSSDFFQVYSTLTIFIPGIFPIVLIFSWQFLRHRVLTQNS